MNYVIFFLFDLRDCYEVVAKPFSYTLNCFLNYTVPSVELCKRPPDAYTPREEPAPVQTGAGVQLFLWIDIKTWE